jgi:hypothetical protein
VSCPGGDGAEVVQGPAAVPEGGQRVGEPLVPVLILGSGAHGAINGPAHEHVPVQRRPRNGPIPGRDPAPFQHGSDPDRRAAVVDLTVPQ